MSKIVLKDVNNQPIEISATNIPEITGLSYDPSTQTTTISSLNVSDIKVDGTSVPISNISADIQGHDTIRDTLESIDPEEAYNIMLELGESAEGSIELFDTRGRKYYFEATAEYSANIYISLPNSFEIGGISYETTITIETDTEDPQVIIGEITALDHDGNPYVEASGSEDKVLTNDLYVWSCYYSNEFGHYIIDYVDGRSFADFMEQCKYNEDEHYHYSDVLVDYVDQNDTSFAYIGHARIDDPNEEGAPYGFNIFTTGSLFINASGSIDQETGIDHSSSVCNFYSNSDPGVWNSINGTLFTYSNDEGLYLEPPNNTFYDVIGSALLVLSDRPIGPNGAHMMYQITYDFSSEEKNNEKVNYFELFGVNNNFYAAGTYEWNNNNSHYDFTIDTIQLPESGGDGSNSGSNSVDSKLYWNVAETLQLNLSESSGTYSLDLNDGTFPDSENGESCTAWLIYNDIMYQTFCRTQIDNNTPCFNILGIGNNLSIAGHISSVNNDTVYNIDNVVLPGQQSEANFDSAFINRVTSIIGKDIYPIARVSIAGGDPLTIETYTDMLQSGGIDVPQYFYSDEFVFFPAPMAEDYSNADINITDMNDDSLTCDYEKVSINNVLGFRCKIDSQEDLQEIIINIYDNVE